MKSEPVVPGWASGSRLTIHPLPESVSPRDIRKLFSELGEVSEVRIHSRGKERITFALLTLHEAEGRECDWLDPLYWNGKKLEVEEGWYYY